MRGPMVCDLLIPQVTPVTRDSVSEQSIQSEDFSNNVSLFAHIPAIKLFFIITCDTITYTCCLYSQYRCRHPLMICYYWIVALILPLKMNGLLRSTIENCGGFFPHFFPETDNPISPI